MVVMISDPDRLILEFVHSIFGLVSVAYLLNETQDTTTKQKNE